MEIERMGNPQMKKKKQCGEYCAQKLRKDKFFDVTMSENHN